MYYMKSKHLNENAMKRNKFLLFLITPVAIILQVFLGLNSGVAQEYEWQVLDTMPFRSAALASCYYDGKIYAIGGSDGQLYDGEYGNDFFQVYDLSTNTWTEGPALPHARMMLAATVVDGKIYVLGGGYPPYLNNYNECFDPETQSWTTKASLPLSTSCFSACVINGKIYVVGGMMTGGGTYCYDPGSDSWTKKASMPFHVATHSASAINNKIYVTGGVDGTYTTIKKLQVYDTETDSWDTTKASMDTVRFGHSSVSVENEIIVMGGGVFAENEKKAFSTAIAYNIETGTWGKITDMPAPVQWGAACINGNKIYLVGGEDKCMMTYSDATVYNYLFELTVTGLTGVEMTGDEQNLRLHTYPNPVNDLLRITIESRDVSNTKLELYNIQGSLVSVLLNEKITQDVYRNKFNLSFLESGIYFLKLKTGEYVEIEKIIKL